MADAVIEYKKLMTYLEAAEDWQKIGDSWLFKESFPHKNIVRVEFSIAGLAIRARYQERDGRTGVVTGKTYQRAIQAIIDHQIRTWRVQREQRMNCA